MSTLIGYLKGALFNGILFFTTLLGSMYLLLPLLPLLLIDQNLFRTVVDALCSIWLRLPGALFECLYGTKLFISGDQVNKNDRVLIIANHRCRLDWMYYWMIQHRLGRLDKAKIILRNDLKWIPGPGWAMQYMMFFFITRKWEVDQEYLRKMLDYYISQDYPIQLTVFPEGTNMFSGSLAKSNSFAEKNNLPKYEYVLHPRVTGFTYMLQKLRHGCIDYVYDVSFGYGKNLCYSEKDLLKGNFPKEVHVHMKRYAISDLPSTDEQLAEWVYDRWAKKENQLSTFYKDNQFQSENEEFSLMSGSGKDGSYNYLYGILVFWYIFLIVSVYGLWVSSVFRLYSVFSIIVHLVFMFKGGIDYFILTNRLNALK